jgi:hypothetical protein
VDIRNGDETFQMPEDFKGHLDGQLRLDREEGIPTTPPVSEIAVSTITLA